MGRIGHYNFLSNNCSDFAGITDFSEPDECVMTFGSEDVKPSAQPEIVTSDILRKKVPQLCTP